MRMFTEVGRRVALHSTGVGKALLAQLDDNAVHAIVESEGLPRHTPHTICEESALMAHLDGIRNNGYTLDEEEEELGVRCVAVPVNAATLPRMALSISGPVSRVGDEIVERAVPLLRTVAIRLASEADGLR
jgi:IclR family acetate operon transcriptional repressor